MTAIETLASMPAGLMVELYAEIIRQNELDYLYNSKIRSIGHLIASSISWRKSKKGYDYWLEIHKQYMS